MNSPEITQRLRSLENSSGVLTPDAVVSDAKDPTSPLHTQFEWDDNIAAHAHRLDQARSLIRSVRLVVREEKHTIKSIAYVRNPDAAAKEQGYRNTATLRSDKESARRAVICEIVRAENALQRAYDVSLQLDMQNAFDQLLAQVRGVREAV